MERRTSATLGARMDEDGNVLASLPNTPRVWRSDGISGQSEAAAGPAAAEPIFDLLALSDGTLLAGGSSSVLRSVDGGSSWAQVGSTGESVLTLAALDDAIFALRDFPVTDGLGKTIQSMDSGATWQPVGSAVLPSPFASYAAPDAVASTITSVDGWLYRGGVGGTIHRRAHRAAGWEVLDRFVERPISAFAETNSRLYGGAVGEGVWRRAEADFVPEWLVAAVPETGTADTVGIGTDWVETHRGVAEVSLTTLAGEPKAGDPLVGHDDLDWQVAATTSVGVLDFRSIFQADVDFGSPTVYAFAVVVSPDEREFVAPVQGRASTAAWINGERLNSDLVAGASFGFDQLRIKLHKGPNRLLIKVSGRSVVWAQFPPGSGLRSSTSVATGSSPLLEAADVWTPVNGGLPSPYVTSLATVDDTLYAGTMDEGVSR
ncbi:MAG: hypothetical protein ABGY41_08875, partial [Candidatus Poribacteria bacterium]